MPARKARQDRVVFGGDIAGARPFYVNHDAGRYTTTGHIWEQWGTEPQNWNRYRSLCQRHIAYSGNFGYVGGNQLYNECKACTKIWYPPSER